MQNYIEVTLLPSPEIDLNFLWAKVYQQVHLALVERQNSDGTVPIGISLPEYNLENRSLGAKLRLFSNERIHLEELDLKKWLFRLSDYTHITGIRISPDTNDSFAHFRRIQPKSNIERLARRKAKRNGIDLEEARKELSGFEEKSSALPFINIKSQSSSKSFRLYIEKRASKEESSTYLFSTYGLSSKSVVPDF